MDEPGDSGRVVVRQACGLNAVDLFAGPGGWDQGARALDLRPLGIELDDQACATRRAAGHWTLQGDVAALDPRAVVAGNFMSVPHLLIGSPPCPTFSNAGSGNGHRLTDIIVAVARDLANGCPDRGWQDVRAAGIVAAERVLRDADSDHWQRDAAMSMLVVEPLRWAVALTPDYIALEQVPPVLPLWQAFGHMLEERGYRCWAGILNAADFGVPQTRERAFLLASKRGQPQPPAPTHARGGALTFEGELLPWVSMAQALGWGKGLVGFPRLSDTPSNKAAGSVEIEGVDYRERDFRSTDEPAFALTEKARSWTVRTGANTMKHSRDPDDVEPYERSCDEPAPTVDPKAGTAWAINTGRDWKPGGTRETAQTVSGDEPAPTLDTITTRQWRVLNPGQTANWTWERPATTVQGDRRVWPPGHKENSADPPGKYQQRRGENAIRLQVWEAAILQSFPRDYPWQGSKTSQFGQIGNAVPPLLAQRVLEALLG